MGAACCGRVSAREVATQHAIQTQTLCLLLELVQRQQHRTCRCRHVHAREREQTPRAVSSAPSPLNTSVDDFADALEDAQNVTEPFPNLAEDNVEAPAPANEESIKNIGDAPQPESTTSTQPKMMYVLRLTDNKWYVGVTERSRLYVRINEHRRKVGSAWTSMYAVEDVVDVVPVNTKWDEDNTVKALMETHGIENVRGGTYSKPKLSADVIRFLTNELRHNNGLCIRCGGTGHMMRQCTA